MRKIFALIAFLGLALSGYADNKPSFPGGDAALQEYLAKNTRYPESAKENGIEGIISVGFVVLPDGRLQEVKVIRFVDPDLEKEAVRVVVAMPAWIPAEKDGTPIEAPAKVDVPFLLE